MTLSILTVGSSAFAQIPATAPPVRELVDANGVDLLTGTMTGTFRGPSIGPGGGFGYTRLFRGSDIWESYTGVLLSNSGGYSVVMDGITEEFDWSETSGTFTQAEKNGATLTFGVDRYTGPYTYTTPAGMVAVFETGLEDFPYPENKHALLTSVTHPNGEHISVEYEYKTETVCHPLIIPGCTLVEFTAARVKSLISNRGYELSVTYRPNSGLDVPEFFWAPERVAIDNLIDNTEVGSVSIAITEEPGTAYVMELTDDLGQVTKFRLSTDGGVIGIARPGNTTYNFTALIDSSTGRVSSVDNNGQVTTYSYSDATGSPPYIRTTTVTRSGGAQRVVTSDLTNARVLTDRDELNRTTTYEYNADERLHRVTAPEGNYVEYTYDARGNVTQTRLSAKPGSGLADIVTSAGFSASCGNPKTCNQPNWTQDAKGNQTDYTYASAHGGVLTVTLPAPSSGAVRPQTRYSYTALEAWYKNSSGVLSASGQPIYLPTSVSTCRTQSTCTGGADESKTVIGYGPTGVGNNLWPVTITSSDGSGALQSTTTSDYDQAGNLLTVDGPLPGTADTTRTHYDELRRSIGVVGPDPDGSGPRKPLATRNTYNTAGDLVAIETGTVNGQLDTDWPSFVPSQTLVLEHDSAGRRTKSSLSASGTTYAVEQTSYDGLGRVMCVATRMNPSVFGSLSASACTLGTTGGFGADRITKLAYDAADQLTKITEGFGTANSVDTITRTYTDNGQIASLADGGGNLTTFEYDGFDRLFKTRYPSPTTPGTSSTTDFEQRTYDPNSNVTAFRARSGQTISFSPDDLNRIVLKDRPGLEDVYFSYDNQDRLLAAAYNSPAGPGVAHSYDALGRLDARSVFGRTLTYDYDAAGRRTQVTHPDGFYVQYSYDLAGGLTDITDSSGTMLASYTYDALGRRDARIYSSGASTTYGYDAVSRLATLTLNLSGTDYDSTVTFGHIPSAQIASRTQSNDAKYGWVPPASTAVTMLHNGLNQVTQVGSTPVSHDPLGNLEMGESTFDYGYDLENQLRSAVSGSTTIGLAYDPLGQLSAVSNNGVATEFLYDGPDLVAEYDSSGAVLRRYVHGAGMDEPLVWYEGSGTIDRRYLHADERGSIVAISDNSGAGIENFKYSPDGKSVNSVNSRFGYTGQVWLAEVGLYYYKSRAYSPELGRFLQPDAIGYNGGMNLYAYVGGDPVNYVDPLGFQEELNGDILEEITLTARRPRFYDTFDRDLYFLDLLWDEYYEGTGEIEAATEWLDEIVVTARKQRQLAGIKINFRLRYPLEQLWIVTLDKHILYVPTKAETYTDSCGNTLGKNVPDGSVTMPDIGSIFAIVHTHPRWAYPWPAAGDYTSAENFSVYNINPSSAWVLRQGAARGSEPTLLSGRAPTPPPSGRGSTCR